MITKEEQKIRRGNLVFDDRITNLRDLIDAANEWFPGVNHNEIYFASRNLAEGHDGYYDLLLGKVPRTHFIERDDSFSTHIYFCPTLAQAISRVKDLPGYDSSFDLSRVRIFWFHGEGELCVSIKKEKPSEPKSDSELLYSGKCGGTATP